MDKRREELEEQRADLHLALLMDEYAERMGKQVREEAEAAFERGELEMPAELDAKCRALISDASTAEEKKKPMRAVVRYALVAALSIVLLLGTLIAVQAAGIDIFGSIATWTDSVFHFQKEENEDPSEIPEEPDNEIQKALRELGMPVELAPTKLPDGYELTVVDKHSDASFHTVCAIAEKIDADRLRIVIQKRINEDLIFEELWEKDQSNVETYTGNGRTFYLFANAEKWTATWADTSYKIKISGACSKDELISIIKSIGENND